MPKFAQLASRLSTRGWLVAGGASLGGILIIYLFMHMISAPSYSTLLSGLEPAQTGKMTAALSAKGIPYELQNNGTALAVQSNEVAQARIALASGGMLGNGSQPGFSLFEKTSLGESNFQQQVTYQRALQGQLEQTIDQIQGVSGSQVELVLPSAQSQVFAESQQPSSAAVLLTTSGALEPSSVRGIAHLVASSVPGLKLNEVTITEGSGQLLWPTQGSEGGEGEGASKQAAQTRYDQQAAAALEAMLAQTLGPGKAQVQVYANLDVNKTTEEQLKYGKTGVPLQQSKNLETLTGSGAGTGGAGTAAIPTYAATSGGKSNYKHEVTNTTLGVEKTVTHSTDAPGTVTNEHVSVLLDNSVPASEVPGINSAVTNAAGLEPKRGDTIYIGRMAFAKTAAAAASSSSSIMGYAKDALLGIAAIVFLFFTTRFLRKREHERIDHEPIWLSELQMPVPLSELEREAAGADHEPTLVASGSPARQRVEQLASSSPDTVAKQLRSWMKED